MASQCSPHNHALEAMIRNLKVDPSSQLGGPPKEGSPSDATSSGEATGSVKESEVDQESLATEPPPVMPAQTPSYYGYYYPGFDGSFAELDDQGLPLEIRYPVMQADYGSLLYFTPGFQPGYGPYSPFAVATIGVDGQYAGLHPYPPNAVFAPAIASPGGLPTPLTYGSEMLQSSYLWDPSFLVGDGAYGSGYIGVPDITDSKQNLSSHNHPCNPPSKSFSLSEFNSPLEVKGSSPSSLHGMRNQFKSANKGSQYGSAFHSHDALGKGYFPIAKHQSYNQGKAGLLYPHSHVNLKANTRDYVSTEKLKIRSKANGFNDLGVLEQNHGPRTTGTKGAFVSGRNDSGSLSAGGDGKNNCVASLIRRDQYNLPDFPTKYDNAFFFVIKSYSEDDIHKSIKYNVWASTPNGNKRLDGVYQEAKERMGARGSKCPVFLFFSVNASGQFCGVAEMIGRVDFNKNMDFWQQDKWNGFFPVKWHIIKDVPNPQLRHIILENNDNKPVTNSRDTQEVRFLQGVEMLNIFKNYVSKTSILDDFDFYESRQKVMQDKKMKPSVPHFDHLQKAEDKITGFQAVDLSAVGKIDESQVGDKTKERRKLTADGFAEANVAAT